ncbi:MAG: phosphoribosylformylglycinamidine synthase subunit PurQ [Verrucomicrobia bacterium]|nr:phosphoribosylformylglycinamidine synthase subunit PurQ [Verrucomicrobiota bacterium]
MKCAVLQFPGSNCDQDCLHVVKNVLGQSAGYVWHKQTSLGDADAVIVPGGFSYGDYLRSGAIAKCSPIMSAVKEFADRGGLVLGICNGFQILTEAGLLPGALVRNRDLKFVCEHVLLQTVSRGTPFTCAIPEGQWMRVPVAHGDGCYYIDPAGLADIESHGQILWRYVNSSGVADEASNPNGSIANIAGVCNKRGNVAGLMPHPERASECILGESSGLAVFQSMVQHCHAPILLNP